MTSDWALTFAATNPGKGGDQAGAPAARAVRSCPPPSTRAWLAIIAALVVTALLWMARDIVPWAAAYPESWIVPIDRWLSQAINWATREATFGPFTLMDGTRAFGALLNAPVAALKALFVTGVMIELDNGVTIALPPFSWLGVTAFFVAIAISLRDRGLAALTLASFLYVAVIGLWESTMITFASIIVAAVIGIVAGIGLGVIAYRSSRIDRALTPVLDFMQTVPVFAYLVPTLILFGYGPAGALIITLIYSLPPMARVTTSALTQLNPEIVELGRMTGCSPRQLLRRVLLPSSRPRLMVGVNQVIMLTLNMVIIASMIGAGGLGYDVWQALKALRLGEGAQAGIAITLLAIVLDRMSQVLAVRRPIHADRRVAVLARHKYLIAGFVLLIALTILGQRMPAIATYPQEATLTSGRIWDHIVDWININLFTYISAVRDAFFIYLLRPIKDFLLSLPWLGVVAFICALGFQQGGKKLMLRVGLLIAFIAIVGLWEKAILSVYLVGICVILSSVIGIPIGIAAAANDRFNRYLQIVLDTLQTLPTFVYLIPVIMLFSVGEFSALIAILMYAIVPAIRYTASAIREVPASAVEAGRAFGCTRLQLLRRVILPLALPDIMLGVNQTIMLGFSMLVITALVGTRDLGQETLVALSKVDPGKGMVAGICVAFLAIMADRLIKAWVDRRRRELGARAV